MNVPIEESLQRWLSAGIIDAATGERIRQFEGAPSRQTGFRWPVILALAFGAILVAAGISLFVAAHWAALSPAVRFLIVIALVLVFHALAEGFRSSFAWMATALHGVGTVAAGVGIFLTGQIFNIREDWSAGVFLCFLCAACGWLLLRDQVQQLLCLLMLPAWLCSEWAFRTDSYAWSTLYNSRLLAILSIVLMTAVLTSRRRLVANVVLIAGTVSLFVSVILMTTQPWENWAGKSPVPLGWRTACWTIAIAAALAGILIRRAALLPIGATLAVSILLPHCQRFLRDGLYHSEPNVLAYALVALYAVLLAWHGVRENSRGMINIGILYFAASVVWFYFSDVMGKLDRSFSLMLLGILLLGGGWLLERVRRRLIAGLAAEPKGA